MMVNAIRNGTRSGTGLTPEPFDIVGQTALQRDTPIEIHVAYAGVVRQQARRVPWPRDAGKLYNRVAGPMSNQAIGNAGHADAAPRTAIDHDKVVMPRLVSDAHQRAH